jgi:DNA helicase-2/ATP-dependent DNA helicase PcrA
MTGRMDNMKILDGLNTEQLAAVKHVQGPMLVIAGAGTGKTQVITRRIAYLIHEHKVSASSILALTFTEKAAREMEDRLYSLIGWQSFQVPVMTFNAFGSELLLRYSSHIGRSIRGGLINGTQKVLLLQQHLHDIDLKYYGPQSHPYDFAEVIVSYIDKLQNAGITSSMYAAYATSLPHEGAALHPSDILEQQDLSLMYSFYERLKEESGTYDYFDQLALPLRILKERPNLADRLVKEYPFVLVDEYQDTSPVQDDLLRSFVPPDGNIFAVGDDDQSIYSFRGADINNIMSFTNHFKNVTPNVLIENYRSGQPILDASYRMIQNNNPERLEAKLNLNKHLISSSTLGSLEFISYETPVDEYLGIAKLVEDRIKKGESLKDIAVLSRSNNPLRSISKVFKSSNIPFSLSAEIDIFSQQEVINLWYLLQWIGEKVDSDAISHIMIGQFFNWSASQYRIVASKSKAEACGPEDAMRMLAGEDGNTLITGALSLIDEWRQWAHDLPISQLVYRLIFETGVSDRIRREGNDKNRILRVYEDLHRLLAQMQDYETVALNPTLAGYLDAFPIPPKLSAGEVIGDTDGVHLLTIHSAKGLEFETVFVINCTQRAWSEHTRSGLNVPDTLISKSSLQPEHEQRRLMYVAITRAKREVILSASSGTTGGSKQSLSPLLSELIEDVAHAVSTDTKISKEELVLQKLQRYYPLKQSLNEATFPFEDNRGWIQLGVGALQLYDECPYDFYLQHVLGIVEPFGVTMAFGSVIHRTIQEYYNAALKEDRVSIHELHAIVDQMWHSKGYESIEESNRDREKAKKVIDWFVKREDDQVKLDPLGRKILGSEVKIIFDLPEAKLRIKGRIDAYFQMPNGVEIRDFKTGRGKTDPDKMAEFVKKNFQLRTYALAYLGLNKVLPSKVTLDYVVTQTEGSAELSERILLNHKQKLIELVARIRKHDFVPAPSSPFHHCASAKFYGDEDMNEIENAVAKNQNARDVY